MNKLILIGNLTRDPEARMTQSGVNVTSFTVAVNRRVKQGEEAQVDYFRVSAWRQLGEICAKYLAKGKKVYVSGAVSARTYQTQQGETRVSLEVTADDVEFLSASGSAETRPETRQEAPKQAQTFTPVETDDLPF